MARRSGFNTFQHRELQKQADDRYDGVLVLKMQDKSTVELSIKEFGQEEKTKKPILSADFTGEKSCPRCGGCHDARGAISGGGFIRARVFCRSNQYWHNALFACSCIYGAWRYTVQKLEYADNRTDIPPLSQDELDTLDSIRMTGETYLEAAESLPVEFDPVPLREHGFKKTFDQVQVKRIEAGMRETREMIERKLEVWKRSMICQEHLL